MAVVADIEGIDLWVQSRELTDEDREEIRRAIQEYREKHPLSEEEREARRVWWREKFGIEVERPENSQ